MEVRNKAILIGTTLSLLGINQGLLTASGSDQKINFSDPSKPDFLRYKAGGKTVSNMSSLLTDMRFLYRVAQDSKKQDLHKAFTDSGYYAYGKLSPFAKKVFDILFAPKQYDQKQLPWSKHAGVHETYPEYASENFLPIPFADAAQEAWKSTKNGKLSPEDATKALLLGGVSGATGVHIMEDKK